MDSEPLDRRRAGVSDSMPSRARSDSLPNREADREADEEASASAQPESAEDGETLDELFSPELTSEYRARWTDVQGGFVDDPRRAVQRGNELVEEVMRNLTQSFASQREQLEEQLHRTGEASTETLRVTLRRYRSFFERLLSI